MMKNKIFAFLFTLLLCMTTIIPVFADNGMSRLVDDADLLTGREESSLKSKLDDISEKHQMDVVIVTVNSLDGKSPRDYADDYYEHKGYGYGAQKDGILFLVSMENRDWYITTAGYGITAITDAGLDYISNKFFPDLSDGNYADAFETYAELCDDFIEQAKTGEPYDVGNLPKKTFNAVKMLIISLIMGLIVAFVVTGVMKGQLKTVRHQTGAGSYVKNGSLKVTESRDFFLYKHVDRRAKPKNNGSGGSSTHRSSSGRSHGGGGGKF